jgi:uncharacterized protein with PQ loop repeat
MKLPFISRKAYDVLKKERREIDWLFWVSGVVGPVSTIPQIITIYGNKNAANVSLLSWGLYTVASLIGVFYGLLHKLRALYVSYILCLIVNGMVAAGVIIYG